MRDAYYNGSAGKKHHWRSAVILALTAALLVLGGCQESGELSLQEKLAEVESGEIGTETGEGTEDAGGAKPAVKVDRDTKKLYDDQNK